VWIELGIAPAAPRLERQAAGGSIHGQRADHEGGGHVKVQGRGVAGMTRLNKARDKDPPKDDNLARYKCIVSKLEINIRLGTLRYILSFAGCLIANST